LVPLYALSLHERSLTRRRETFVFFACLCWDARSIVLVGARSRPPQRSIDMRLTNVFFVSALMLFIAACTQTPTRDSAKGAAESAKPHPTAADYRRYIRGNAGVFSSASVYDWEAPDPNHVVVWTSPAEAYLLTLFGACFGLESVQTILLSGDGGTVRAGAAAVMVGSERCPIQTVERLDARAMKVDGVH
jgi:hypothetical protein